MRKIVPKAKYLVIDLEMTGLDPQKNGIIQFAALALDTEIDTISEFNHYVKPPNNTEYTAEAKEMSSHITQDMIDSGLSYKQVCVKFLEFVRDNFNNKPIVVGQFFPMDFAFLTKMFKETVPEIDLFKDVLDRNFVDTKSLVNTLNLRAELENKPSLFPNTSLSAVGGLKDTLGISETYKAHDALEDCYATKDVLGKLMQLFCLVN
jgi:DNA polymerase III epsilon subunit-like protein